MHWSMGIHLKPVLYEQNIQTNSENQGCVFAKPRIKVVSFGVSVHMASWHIGMLALIDVRNHFLTYCNIQLIFEHLLN